MKNNVFIFSVLGVIVVSVLGCLSHFAYEWLGNKPITAFLFATNESVFQHMKIFLIPYFSYGVFEYLIYGKNIVNFIPVKTLSLLLGAIFIPIFFYSYSGILGFNIVWVDISIFFMAVILSFIISNIKMNQTILPMKTDNSIWLIILLIVMLFTVIFSYFPPKLGLFIPEQ